jgi:TolA-binding protein
MKGLIILLLIVLGLVASIMPLSDYAARKAFANPQESWAEPTAYFAARTRMRLARFAPAVAILQRAIQVWPKSDRVDEAHFWIAFCYERSGAHEAAVAWYKSFLQAYPNHRWATQAKRRLDSLEAQGL